MGQLVKQRHGRVVEHGRFAAGTDKRGLDELGRPPRDDDPELVVVAFVAVIMKQS